LVVVCTKLKIRRITGFIHTVQGYSLLLHHRNWSLSLNYFLGHTGPYKEEDRNRLIHYL
jgi:hypothetical protein